VRHTLAVALHRFFDEHDYYYVHTPNITASDCEGAGQMFRVSTLDLVNLPRTSTGAVDFSQDFFGREARLTVSGQLNVESYCCALTRVYTFGPTFRAETATPAATFRVLDDRARACIRITRRERRSCRGDVEVCSMTCSGVG
jgi:asparaginyl-tRNA synthetase